MLGVDVVVVVVQIVEKQLDEVLVGEVSWVTLDWVSCPTKSEVEDVGKP